MKEFKKYFKIQAKPSDVYNAMTNPVMIEFWSGEDADMKEEVGYEFTMFDGNVVGKNLELEKNKKIVQHWYFEGQQEDSIVTIKLHDMDNHTSVELRHTNIPDDAWENITEGWTYSYFDNIAELLEDIEGDDEDTDAPKGNSGKSNKKKK